MPAKTRTKIFIHRKHCASLSEEEMNFRGEEKFPIIFISGQVQGKDWDSTVISLRDKPAAESQIIKKHCLMCQHGHGNEVYKVSDAAQWTAYH